MPKERVEMLRLKFGREVALQFARALQQYALSINDDGETRRRLLAACARFDGWIAGSRDKVRCEAPVESWRWLAGQCVNFKSGGVGGSLARLLSEREVRSERSGAMRGLEEDDKALAQAAREYREREGAA